VPDTLAGEVGVPPPEHHGDAGKEIRHGGEEADLKRREAEGLDHLRHPKADAVQSDHDAEIEQCEHEDARLGQSIAERVIARVTRRLGFCRELGFERMLFILAEPRCLCRPVREQFERGKAEQHCRQSFDDEQPVPTFQPAQPVQLEQRLVAMAMAVVSGIPSASRGHPALGPGRS